jgi:hypothetical protein
MTKPLTQDELQLAAIVLELASDEFAYHGCNDFHLPEKWSQKQCDSFLLSMYTWNGDPDLFEAGDRLAQDWMVMEYLAERMTEVSS